MPSFANDENSPIYDANSGVVHLGSNQHPHTGATIKGSIVQPRPLSHPTKRKQDQQQLHQQHHPVDIAQDDDDDLAESLDDFDNSSTQSSDTSESRARMNGDSGSLHPSVMTTLPNGGKPSRGLAKGFDHHNATDATSNAVNADKVTLNGQNGRMSHPSQKQQRQHPEKASVENHGPAINGHTRTQSPPPTSHFPPHPSVLPPEPPTKQNWVESPTRISMQQTPVDAVQSKPFTNGDRTPRASHDAVVASPSSPTTHHNPPSKTGTPDPEQQQRQGQPPLGHRDSSPPHYHSAGTTPSLSTSALVGPGAGLKHRSTLDVPRLQPGRGSKDGVDTAAAYASGRFSPTAAGSGQRRASLSLARRNTRSLHSEMPRDEIVPDDDALRWAEAYRQKRAKKKKKEDFDDDKVLVGTKVDENHANWTTAYNMLTGIRVSVSRTNAKIDRPLTDADFEAKQKSTFDIAGNELVPSAKYDFKFKDYAPWVFRHLRALFRLDPADYLMSLTGKYILSELGSPGKSGSFFYFSRDYKYIIKTIHHAEHKFLRKILKEYYTHVTDNPNTLLSQFYGLHRVKMPYGKKIHFVVMNNLFPPHRDIHTTFDLKGSTVGRDYKEEDLAKNPRATLKDLNWLRRKRHLELGLHKKQLFLKQLEKDVRLMQKLKIMDYSLLIGVHDLQKGNEENLRGKTLQVFHPGGSGRDPDDIDPHAVLMRTPSKMESVRKARELRQMIKAERPIPMGQTSNRMPEELEEGQTRGGIFYNDDGGLRATHEDNTPAEEVYYLGVIDCLTHYGMIKKIEHFWKGLSADRTQISALPPVEYGDRFLKFMSGITMSAEEAVRDEIDRQAAAAAVSNEAGVSRQGSLRNSATAPPAPNYLPPAPPGMRSPRSPEPNPVLESATRQAFHSEKDLNREDDVPDRKLTTSSSGGPAPVKPPAHTVLPIVEEAGEAGSVGGRSRGESVGGSRPFTPNQPEHTSSSRADGFTDLGPHGIGGRGPPTPPKSSYLDATGFNGTRSRSGSGNSASIGKGVKSRISRDSLDKALPPLPQAGV